MPKTIKDIGEFGFIEELKKKSPKVSSVALGIGDDTAVLERKDGEYDLLTTDFLIEGRHFDLEKDKPKEIGWKAMVRSLSDIAAMGGKPTSAVIGLMVPEDTSVSFLKALHQGIEKAASKFNCPLVGGDTSKSDQLALSVTILGYVEKTRLCTRKGAKEGDWIFTTGFLGHSIQKKHKTFVPRLEEAECISDLVTIHSMIDISDGLAQDLNHILNASKVSAVLFENQLPLSKDLLEQYRNKKDQIQHCLYDGEDYELLFTISSQDGEVLLRNWRHSTPLSYIGEIQKKKSHPIYLITEQGEREEIAIKGFKHF